MAVTMDDLVAFAEHMRDIGASSFEIGFTEGTEGSVVTSLACKLEPARVASRDAVSGGATKAATNEKPQPREQFDGMDMDVLLRST
jgi:vacuolar-type H+-ATPase subunit B/Vma2